MQNERTSKIEQFECKSLIIKDTTRRTRDQMDIDIPVTICTAATESIGIQRYFTLNELRVQTAAGLVGGRTRRPFVWAPLPTASEKSACFALPTILYPPFASFVITMECHAGNCLRRGNCSGKIEFSDDEMELIEDESPSSNDSFQPVRVSRPIIRRKLNTRSASPNRPL